MASEEAREERLAEAACAAAAVRFERTWDGTLYHLDDLARVKGGGPGSMGLAFTPWKDKVW